MHNKKVHSFKISFYSYSGMQFGVIIQNHLTTD